MRNDDESNWVLHLEFRQDLVHELTLLAQSYESLELVFGIYKKLLSYAQVFERYTPFKVEMGFGKEDEWNSHSSTRPTSYCFRYEDLRGPNPFKGDAIHPVESALMEAKETSARHDAPGTKARRGIVLEYLEPQFRRKESARCALSQFIEKESNAGGLLISEDIKTFVDETAGTRRTRDMTKR